MKRKPIVIGFALAAVLAGWLFIGYEKIYNHDGDRSELFIKQRPMFQVVFRNTVLCGECDVEPIEHLTPPELKEFERFCRARHGLATAPCYEIYAREQREADERLGIQRETAY
ncbi:hypothetical protein [Chitinolyticbacter meiyuanensis]|uniref:hypothetical protein n=1 Tax=Chitinolyticbacter meiyuanensis TaxID=682798 RepID=UPI0011E5D4F7|nr:hypothetical protein [Chitinolyticbacter meiyuanensis]